MVGPQRGSKLAESGSLRHRACKGPSFLFFKLWIDIDPHGRAPSSPRHAAWTAWPNDTAQQGLRGLDCEAIRPGTLHAVLRLQPRATTTVAASTPSKPPKDHAAASLPPSRSAKRKRLEVPDSESDADEDDADALATAEAGRDTKNDGDEEEAEQEAEEEDSYGWAETDDVSMAVVAEDLIRADNDKLARAEVRGSSSPGASALGARDHVSWERRRV